MLLFQETRLLKAVRWERKSTPSFGKARGSINRCRFCQYADRLEVYYPTCGSLGKTHHPQAEYVAQKRNNCVFTLLLAGHPRRRWHPSSMKWYERWHNMAQGDWIIRDSFALRTGSASPVRISSQSWATRFPGSKPEVWPLASTEVHLGAKRVLSSVKSTRALQMADCDADHALVIRQVQCTDAKTVYKTMHAKWIPKVMSAPPKMLGRRLSKFCYEFTMRVKSPTSGAETPDKAMGEVESRHMRKCHGGFQSEARFRNDWMEANADKVDPLLERKRSAIIACKSEKTQGNHDNI